MRYRDQREGTCLDGTDKVQENWSVWVLPLWLLSENPWLSKQSWALAEEGFSPLLFSYPLKWKTQVSFICL